MDNEKNENILEFTDPVCGMSVTEDSAVGKSRFENLTYYFCSLDCKLTFDMQPNDYTKSTAPK